jgi:hypothetical protein
MSNLLGLNQVLHDFGENRGTELTAAPGFRLFVPLFKAGAAAAASRAASARGRGSCNPALIRVGRG